MSVKKTTTSKQTNNHICSGGLEPKYKLNLVRETIFQSTIFELMMIIVFRSILLDYLKYQFGVFT